MASRTHALFLCSLPGGISQVGHGTQGDDAPYSVSQIWVSSEASAVTYSRALLKEASA